mmetsp:Transcript_24136/g.26807  ORF Transcript_24136/g.26807 Transcript_24136/m.26807 type:complete len:91 (-) Transcript_24136:28-300(-)
MQLHLVVEEFYLHNPALQLVDLVVVVVLEEEPVKEEEDLNHIHLQVVDYIAVHFLLEVDLVDLHMVEEVLPDLLYNLSIVTRLLSILSTS